MKNIYTVVGLGISLLLVQQNAVTSQSGAVPRDTSVASTAPRFIPFGTGERMDFQVKYGLVNAGKASVEMKGIETLRGTQVWKADMRVEGGVIFLYTLKATYSSWFDTTNLHSLRYVRKQVERGNVRDRHFDIFPERAVYKQKIAPDTLPELPSVSNPLDETSFLYFVRTVPLEVGQTYTWERYFRPDRNPVVLKVLRKEKVNIPAGEFDAIVVEPVIKASGFFSEEGKAKVWLSDDPLRMILKIESQVGPASIHMLMTKYTHPKVRGR